MIYASADFVFFVAFTLIGFFLSPARFRIFVLLLASLFWYSVWSLSWLAIIVSIIVLNQSAFALARWLGGRRRHWLFFSLLVANSLIFIGLKAWPYWRPGTETPYGASFFMMMLLGLNFDRWREVPEASGEIPPTSLMVIFFPLLLGGPIERARHLAPQLIGLQPDFGDVRDGILIFAWGFSKRFFLGLPLSLSVHQLFEDNTLSLPLLFGAGVLGTIQAYLDFSSYCDMGRGAARCFGIKLAINFRPFYYSRNPLDFWQRWNISIATWMRDYFTMPLLLRFGRRIEPNLLVFCSFLLIGLWHGLHWNWVAFGLWNGTMVCLFIVTQKRLKRFPSVVSTVGIFLVFLTYCANGLLQRSDFMTLIQDSWLLSTSRGSFDPSEWCHSLLGLCPYVLGWLGMEYFQERKGALDFFLDWPVALKNLSAFALIVGYLAILRLGWTADIRLDLPAYFRF
jgi:D-alanyl-lipoteichoic acid acyltransferase DltB (MBOAT superfamily)